MADPSRPSAVYGSAPYPAQSQEPSTAKRADERRRSPDQYISVLFRFLQLAASVTAFVVMLFARQAGLSWRFYEPFRYLIAATVISAAWALLFFLLELLQLIIGKKIRFLFHRIFVAAGDYIMTFLLLSAGAAAAGVTTFHDHYGVPPNFTPCHGVILHSFCARTKAATAATLIAAFFFIPHVILSTMAAVVRSYEG